MHPLSPASPVSSLQLDDGFPACSPLPFLYVHVVCLLGAMRVSFIGCHACAVEAVSYLLDKAERRPAL
jgi:hypothetical protein